MPRSLEILELIQEEDFHLFSFAVLRNHARSFIHSLKFPQMETYQTHNP